MRKITFLAVIGLVFVLIFSGCQLQKDVKVVQQRVPQVIGEEEPIVVPETTDLSTIPNLDELATLWKGSTHKALTTDAADYWGLSYSRKSRMTSAADMPDVYQAGLDAGFNQQWSHAYLYTGWGTWIWGDADDDFHDNINQETGELESPEGYNDKSAKYYYERNDQYNGDWYVGYATHYIEDVCLILHASDPSLNMLTKHFDFESWIANNWTSGHNFAASVANDPYYYSVTDLKQSIRNAAYNCSYWTSTLGETVWDAYISSGYPTASGSGNSTLVSNTRTMLIRAARYTRGTIKYALDEYNQW